MSSMASPSILQALLDSMNKSSTGGEKPVKTPGVASAAIQPSDSARRGMSGMDFLKLVGNIMQSGQSQRPVKEEDQIADTNEADHVGEKGNPQTTTKVFLKQVQELVDCVITRLDVRVAGRPTSPGDGGCSPPRQREETSTARLVDDRRHLVSILSLRVWADKMRHCRGDASKLVLTPATERKIVEFVELYLSQFPHGYARQLCDAQVC